jgi:hypothetical protein
MNCSNSAPAKSLVGDEDLLAVQQFAAGGAFEQRGGDLALGFVGVRREPSESAVVGRLAGDVREQVAQPLAREPQEAPLGRAIEEDLRDRERDQLGVGDSRSAPWAAAREQEIVDHHIKCGEQGVEFGEHEATSVVDVALATPNAELRRPRYVPSPRNAAKLFGITHLGHGHYGIFAELAASRRRARGRSRAQRPSCHRVAARGRLRHKSLRRPCSHLTRSHADSGTR